MDHDPESPRTVCVAVADGKRDGRTHAMCSWNAYGASQGRPLAYCERMNKTCRSHTNFRVMSGSWDEVSDKLERRK